MDDYSLAEHAPWLTFFSGEKGEAPDKEKLFKNSLEIAVQLAKTDQFDEYKSGFGAFEKWIEQLNKQSDSKKIKTFEEHEINSTIFNYLADSHQAAIGYLTSENKENKMNRGHLIINNYTREVDLLKDARKNVLPSYDSGSETWTSDIISKEINVFTQVLSIENETIYLIEEELNN